MLAALVLVNLQGRFRRRLTRSRSIAITRVVVQTLAFIGLVADFRHIWWSPG